MLIGDYERILLRELFRINAKKWVATFWIQLVDNFANAGKDAGENLRKLNA